jgi:hypothetical protein
MMLRPLVTAMAERSERDIGILRRATTMGRFWSGAVSKRARERRAIGRWTSSWEATRFEKISPVGDDGRRGLIARAFDTENEHGRLHGSHSRFSRRKNIGDPG